MKRAEVRINRINPDVYYDEDFYIDIDVVPDIGDSIVLNSEFYKVTHKWWECGRKISVRDTRDAHLVLTIKREKDDGTM